MVWVYEQPFTKSEEEAHKILKRRLRGLDIAKETVKLMSLVKFLKDSNFKTPKEIQESVFHDKEKKNPVFDDQTAKIIFKEMKKRGGAVSEYPFTDYGIKEATKKVVSFLPGVIQYPLNTIYGLITYPVSTLKENVPLADVALGAIHSGTEIGVTTATDAAKSIGGPIGVAIALPFTAIAATIAAGTAVLGQDIGQAAAHLINVIPVFGSAFGKGLTRLESMVRKLEEHPGVGANVPLVGTYISTKNMPAEGTPPVATAGKRFSTQKNRYTKWQKTRRNKSAKT